MCALCPPQCDLASLMYLALFVSFTRHSIQLATISYLYLLINLSMYDTLKHTFILSSFCPYCSFHFMVTLHVLLSGECLFHTPHTTPNLALIHLIDLFFIIPCTLCFCLFLFCAGFFIVPLLSLIFLFIHFVIFFFDIS